jgi:hypothetical protein
MFRAGLHSHLKIVTIGMKGSTLQQPKEATMLCEEGMITIEAMSALSIPHSIKQVIPAKTQNNKRNTNKHYINCGMKNHNVKTCRKKKKQTTVATTQVAQPSQKAQRTSSYACHICGLNGH